MIIGDCGSVWTKIYYSEEDRIELMSTTDFISRNEITFDISTGHSGKKRTLRYENELIALSEGGLKMVEDENFTILDAGGRDTKYVKFKNRKVTKLDWNISCGSSTGATLEMLCKYYNIDIRKIPYNSDWISVTCGIFALEKIMESVSARVEPLDAISRFVHGLARNVYFFAQKPEKLYVSGGFSESDAFLKSLENYCVPIPLGRYVLIEGLKTISGA